MKLTLVVRCCSSRGLDRRCPWHPRLVRLQPRTARRDGHITLFGKDACFKPHEVARLGVAYVPEGRGVFPNLSVRENLVMAAR